MVSYELTWGSWNEAYVTTTASSTATTWKYWIGSATCSDSTTDATITWVKWNSSYKQFALKPHVETEEERQQREAAARRRQEEARQRQIEREKAEQRARELLVAFLNGEQRESYEKSKQFTVISKDGQRTYRIKHGRSGNVELLNERGVAVKRFCIHPQMDVPDADTALAQKLMIEHDEDRFLKIANVTRLAS